MSYVPKDSKGRIIKPTQTLARKYNCAKGQVAMARGCIQSLQFHVRENTTMTTAATLQNLFQLLECLKQDLERDYQLIKYKMQLQARKGETK